ncbi:MAG: PepSY domain-containing protein [Anaerotignum sp.]|nr:PepSY domain-containing protein [Anaerotignum sp.]
MKASEVRDLDIEKDRDDGIVKYEIDFESGRMEYEYEIHAETGKILKAEKDYDD